MESRVVYRRLGDVLGYQSHLVQHPHSFLTRRLRCDYRETRDYFRLKGTYALSLAAFAGNQTLDVERIGEKVFETIREMQDIVFPHAVEKNENTRHDHDSSGYDRYFALLKEMDRKKSEHEGKKTGENEDGIMLSKV